jgi:hypothetical protein
MFSMNKKFWLLRKTLICFLALFLLVIEGQTQSLNTKQQDSLFLAHPFKDKVQAMKKSLAKSFVNFKGNDLSLFGSLSLNNQTINDKGITAPLNYLYSAVNSNSFNPGYSGGFRWDGTYNEKHQYSFSLAVNRVSAGNYYKNKYTLPPFIDDFTHYKADNQFTTISLAAHYKKLLPINDMRKYKFYAVYGPSFDYKISKISNAHLVNGAGNRAFINADLGAEFDNKGYYVLYAHYKLGTNLFQSTVPVQMNRFEIGMSIKAKDLF